LKSLEPSIEVHHGSLSREQRHTVEDRFKAGDLKGIVCTSTLQLGIDVGEVDLTIQYLSPRQVSALIQRVGRAGHTLGEKSEGVLITAYGEDALESLVAAEKARGKELEETILHIKALDVLAHQIVGLSLDNTETQDRDAYELVKLAYPFNTLSWGEFRKVLTFLASVGQLTIRDGIIKRKQKGRMYYYENLGMINDERRYPFIDVVTDRMIGTVGDEFWMLRARVGLTVILKGRVWKILQIDDERGVLHVVPSEDPLAAHPGWDGELIPVPAEMAQRVGAVRGQIVQEIENQGGKEKAVEVLAERFNSDVSAVKAAADEVEAQREAGYPVPTDRNILLEAYDRYLIVHSSLGEKGNRTLGAVLDTVLSDHDLIYSWWNDPYRILIEAPRKLDRFDLEKVEDLMGSLSNGDVDKSLDEFIEARFPFGYRMKFIAERFGVIPRGKLMDPEKLENLYVRFQDTPIHRETIREVHMEILDLPTAKETVREIREGVITIYHSVSREPSPLARHILEKYADVAELMESSITSEDQLEYMKKSMGSRTVHLACMNCTEWSHKTRIRELEERPTCGNCGSGLLAVLRRNQEPEQFLNILKRFKEGQVVSEEAKEELTKGRKTADMVLSYGKQAVISLNVRGIGPVTTYQILSRMIQGEKEFYSALLKAKIQYMKTRQYWDNR
jgi:ATP-dependent Lhr-like helicase